MQYKINCKDLKISDAEKTMIDTRLGLNLSRFVTVVDNYTITIEEASSADNTKLVMTSATFTLPGTNKISLEARADKLDNAVLLLVGKSKRIIDRHLKHRQLNRISTDSVRRL
ncbi:hypothetical protein [Agaribacter marinus]|uniref:Uncharacterized protein n=1 Tax=Agaribacter marinus TaxID=1431249 RepID=A0AA37SWM3_9ALTE|nr:hypothetical protein [Agaribacter marinus]GLR70477.1 hypothetical protein GCM10007852_13850 [Agaribacter marinus]